MGRIWTLPRFENRNGVATSSSPWKRAREGNEDVAAPLDAGTVGVLSPRPGLIPFTARSHG